MQLMPLAMIYELYIYSNKLDDQNHEPKKQD